MSNTLPKIIAIVGPTATGKSDLGVFLARKFKGEIISSDSRQIYKGMDIGTGKITKKEMKGVVHHFLSLVSPARGSYNVYKFKLAAQKKIFDILQRGKIPILVGGTGFWIDAVALNQDFPDAPPNQALRNRLEKLSAEQLFTDLKKLDPVRAKNIDPKNKRRLIRAIEVAKFLKSKKLIPQKDSKPLFNVLFIGLDLPDRELDKKILLRLQKRLKAGMIAEVQELHKNGVSWKKLEGFGLEYRFIAQYLQKKVDREEMQQLLFYAIRHYAKRQRTWFKRNNSIHWLDASNKKMAQNRSYKIARHWLKS